MGVEVEEHISVFTEVEIDVEVYIEMNVDKSIGRGNMYRSKHKQCAQVAPPCA